MTDEMRTFSFEFKLTEVEQLDLINHGCDMAAEALLKIAKTGEHAGIFGGKKLEEAAQAILGLYRSIG